ncbi:MAG: ATPase, partial [Firmicutes bacterium]|nr:ATPase [Bacillota bacterium]
AAVFQTPAAVCVNKADQSPEHTQAIRAYCAQNGVAFLGTIPYDPKASAAVNAGQSLADFDCPASRALRQVYHKTIKVLEGVPV